MRKTLKITLVLSAVLFLLSFADVLLELFGYSVCFFGRPIHAWIVLPLILSGIALTACF